MELTQNFITILAAMITPAVLILACGSLSLTTSQRLSRSMERTRKIYEELRETNQGRNKIPKNEKLMLLRQLSKAARRSILMQNAMTLLYIAMSFFITTSLLIGIYEIMGWKNSLIIIFFAMTGGVTLLTASIALILETRLALAAVYDEMKFRIKKQCK